MERLSERFWARWDNASELKKLNIVEELGLYRVAETCVKAESAHALNTLVNSFFVDLVAYIRKVE